MVGEMVNMVGVMDRVREVMDMFREVTNMVGKEATGKPNPTWNTSADSAFQSKSE